MGPSIELVKDSTAISIDKNEVFYGSYHDAASYTPSGGTSGDVSGFFADTPYILRGPGGTLSDASLPALNILNAMQTPDAFTLTAPNLAVDYPFATVTKSQGTTFTWSTGKPGDAVSIVLRGYSLTGQATDGLTGENLRCLASDDGSFQISAQDLSLLTNANVAIVVVAKYNTTTWPFVENQSSSGQGLATITQIGALSLQ